VARPRQRTSTRSLWERVRSALHAPSAVCAMAILCAPAAQPARADGDHPPKTGPSALSEVVVKARRALDKRALKHAAAMFTQSHATLNPRTGQISRWDAPVCPVTRGLQPRYDHYVSQTIVAIAQAVGAPSGTARHCSINIQILFTKDPQRQVDRIAKIAPAMLGYTNGSFKKLATVRFPIQAWYVTGWAKPGDVTAYGDSHFQPIVNNMGRYPSRFEDIESRIEYELVVVDETKVGEYSLEAVSDYIAMLVLTSTAQDGCNALPSIIDLLSADCGHRARPRALTQADKAFLRALYSASFGVKVNLEKGEISHQLAHGLGR
jgi:hypothetical protein